MIHFEVPYAILNDVYFTVYYLCQTYALNFNLKWTAWRNNKVTVLSNIEEPFSPEKHAR